MLILLLIGAIFYKIAVFINTHKTEPIVTFASPSESPDELKKPKITTQIIKKPSSASSASASMVLAAVNTTSSFSVAVPEQFTDSLSLNFGTQEGFGNGWGDTGSGFGQSGGGALTLFGRTGGGGLVGKFYDQKIDRKKKITKLGEEFVGKGKNLSGKINTHGALIKSLHKDNFSTSRMNDFYVASTELSFTQIVMENERAEIAPKAFNVEKEVTPSGWIVIYEGIIAAPKPGDYKFVGRFDDILMVYIDNKLVFDGCWGKSKYSNIQKEHKTFGRKNIVPMPLLASDYIRLGSSNKIKILVGETPGGSVGGGLFIKEEGKKYKMVNGQEVLPPFSTEELNDTTKERLKAMSMPIEVDDVPVFNVL